MVQNSRKRKLLEFMDETSPLIQITTKRVRPNYPEQKAGVFNSPVVQDPQQQQRSMSY